MFYTLGKISINMMENKKDENLRAQGLSEAPGFGARGVTVPGSPVSSSGLGPVESTLSTKIKDSDNCKSRLKRLPADHIYEDITRAMETLNLASCYASRRIRDAVDSISDGARELYIISFELEEARNYLVAKAEQLNRRIEDLDSEIRALKIFSALDRNWMALKREGDPDSLIGESGEFVYAPIEDLFPGSGLFNSSLRSISIVRDELSDEDLRISLYSSISKKEIDVVVSES